jgi:hypothetical protein
MAAIGNSPTQQAFTPAIDYFSGNGSTTAFTLSRPVASVAQVQVTIDNVAQNPSSAYTVSANTITFTSAPLSGTNNIYVYYTSPITQVIAPGQGTVNTTALGNITNIASGNSSLTLQTGASNTTAVTVNTSQNVGIGGSPSYKLDVQSSVAGQPIARIYNSTSNEATIQYTTQHSASSDYKVGASITVANAFEIYSVAAATSRMAIISTGDVGIGTTTPKVRLAGKVLSINNPDSGTNYQSSIELLVNGASAGELWANSSDFVIGSYSTQPIIFRTQNTERARINSSGQLIMASNANGLLGQIQAGITANSASTNSVITSTCNSSGPYPFGARGETSSQGLFGFFNESNSVIGSITRSGSNVAYNTSSDYRLKENIAPMTGALAKVAQLKPVTYTWKADGLDGEGFIAHELAEVKPHAVFGEKDAVDEHGGIKPQGIDTSFLVATLTAAIQELKQINDTQAETINALTARIEALENR